MTYTQEDVIRMESERWGRVAEAITPVADEICQIWAQGDGQGGILLDYIAEHLTSLGYRDCHTDRTAPPTPSRKGRDPIPGSVRKLVFERDKYRCQHCGDHKNLCLDHIHPHSRGGSSEPENLQVLCRKCNVKKGAKVE